MNPLLDPAAASEAGRPHGQIASGLVTGGLVLSAHKIVEEGARALILYAPDLFRMDVRPVEDTLEVMTRSLNDATEYWRNEDNPLENYGLKSGTAQIPYRATWRYVLDIQPRPIVGQVLLLTTLAQDSASRHFAVHAVLQEGEPGALRWAG